MRTGIDSRIDAFQELLEQAASLHGQLQLSQRDSVAPARG